MILLNSFCRGSNYSWWGRGGGEIIVHVTKLEPEFHLGTDLKNS